MKMNEIVNKLSELKKELDTIIPNSSIDVRIKTHSDTVQPENKELANLILYKNQEYLPATPLQLPRIDSPSDLFRMDIENCGDSYIINDGYTDKMDYMCKTEQMFNNIDHNINKICDTIVKDNNLTGILKAFYMKGVEDGVQSMGTILHGNCIDSIIEDIIDTNVNICRDKNYI